MPDRNPEGLALWVPLIRDIVIIGLAIFAVVFGILSIHDTTLLTVVLGFGLTMLGVPAALRLDAARRKQNGAAEDEERWSHLP